MSAAEKAALRTRFRWARRRLSPEERRREQAATCAVLKTQLISAGTTALASYAAAGAELDLDELHQWWWSLGRVLWLPRVLGDGVLAWHGVAAGESLHRGAHGIREPTGQGAMLPTTAVVLVPGIAFDDDGHRLGQGGGYYDRVLAEHPGPAIGVGFACQRCPRLPREEHDRRLHGTVLGGDVRIIA